MTVDCIRNRSPSHRFADQANLIKGKLGQVGYIDGTGTHRAMGGRDPRSPLARFEIVLRLIRDARRGALCLHKRRDPINEVDMNLFL